LVATNGKSKFSGEPSLAPLNSTPDRQPARWKRRQRSLGAEITDFAMKHTGAGPCVVDPHRRSMLDIPDVLFRPADQAAQFDLRKASIKPDLGEALAYDSAVRSHGAPSLTPRA